MTEGAEQEGAAPERLNRYLARAGVASRRGADVLIAAGRIAVNGKVVTDLGTKVDRSRDEVTLDGAPVGKREPPTYVAVYKPRNVITAARDPAGRPVVTSLVTLPVRLFPIGRLDGASEGLVLLTNDGELAERIAHPRYGHEREYRVKISGTPTEQALQAWREGMYLDDGRTLPARVTIESSSGAGTWLRFVMREGRNRQIRRMVEAFHHRVHRLIRVRMGPIAIGTLQAGQWRHLSAAEVHALGSAVGAADASAGGKPPRGTRYKPGWARPKPRPRSGRRGKRPGGRNRPR